MSTLYDDRIAMAEAHGHDALCIETRRNIERLTPQWEKARQALATAQEAAREREVVPTPGKALAARNLATAWARIEAD
jgi:hypothetical protein